ncbi:MAG: hypothetical protein WBQ78_09395 [Gammaproteobacteria bacterium]
MNNSTRNYRKKGFGMIKYLLICFSFFLVLFGSTSGSGIINAGFDEITYGIVAGTDVIDNFAQVTEPTVMILLATGVIGLFSVSRNMFKR